MPSITQKLDELIKAAGGSPSGNGLSIDQKLKQLGGVIGGGSGGGSAPDISPLLTFANGVAYYDLGEINVTNPGNHIDETSGAYICVNGISVDAGFVGTSIFDALVDASDKGYSVGIRYELVLSDEHYRDSEKCEKVVKPYKYTYTEDGKSNDYITFKTDDGCVEIMSMGPENPATMIHIPLCPLDLDITFYQNDGEPAYFEIATPSTAFRIDGGSIGFEGASIVDAVNLNKDGFSDLWTRFAQDLFFGSQDAVLNRGHVNFKLESPDYSGGSYQNLSPDTFIYDNDQNYAYYEFSSSWQLGQNSQYKFLTRQVVTVSWDLQSDSNIGISIASQYANYMDNK